MKSEVESRQLGYLVLMGMLVMPAVFCWLLLRRGYRGSLRRAGFSYAAAMTAVGLMGQFGR
jgi:hypothetical protein